MKKIFAFAVLLGLASCATSESITYKPQNNCRYDSECTITSIHDHAYVVVR